MIGQQFSGITDGKIPQAHSIAMHPHLRELADADGPPLSEGTRTFGSVKTAAAWRKHGVMPYSKETSGSTFNPFD